jgi:hypothetical protein
MICSNFDHLVMWDTLKGVSSGSLDRKLSFHEQDMCIWVTLWQFQHLKDMCRQVPCVMGPIICCKPWHHLTKTLNV